MVTTKNQNDHVFLTKKLADFEKRLEWAEARIEILLVEAAAMRLEIKEGKWVTKDDHPFGLTLT